MVVTKQAVVEAIRYRNQTWMVLLELNGQGFYPWRWWAKPTTNGSMIRGVLGFAGRTSSPTAAVFQARDMLERYGIADYQIYHVPALRRVAPLRWPQPHLRSAAATLALPADPRPLERRLAA